MQFRHDIGTTSLSSLDAATRPADSPSNLRSICGRPRALTAAQVDQVLAWHDARLTLAEFASHLGVSESTITSIIRSRGTHYKQPPPEERAANFKVVRKRRNALVAANLI